MHASRLGLFGFCLGLGIACADAPEGTGSAYLDRLQACGLLSEGELPTLDADELSNEVACIIECATSASCADLTMLSCSASGQLMPSEELAACYQACNPAGLEEFACADGLRIPGEWACDGLPDCADSSDELDCVELECADASGTYLEGLRCDGAPFCADGSDELDCPGYIECADQTGSTPASAICDGKTDCDDGSDELDCPTYACANGQVVLNGARCDFNVDCVDRSDESGCAEIICD